MFVWVVYDIKIDKTRNRVIKQCKKYGLYRVQKSVFFGDIEQSALGSLKIMMRYIIHDIEDSVYIFPMTKKHLDEAKFIGLSFNKSLVIGESKSIFF